jgi:hypothetical protein
MLELLRGVLLLYPFRLNRIKPSSAKYRTKMKEGEEYREKQASKPKKVPVRFISDTFDPATASEI